MNGTRPPQPPDISKATAAELLSIWGPLTAQSGTYEVQGGGRLSWKPSVAKNPAMMAQQAPLALTYTINGANLSIVEPSGRVTKLTRLE